MKLPGVDALLPLLNPSRPGAADGELFPVRVIRVQGESALVQVGTTFLEVKSRVPLKSGQILLVRQEQQGGETVWRVIRGLGEGQLSGAARGVNDLALALNRAGLAATGELLHQVEQLVARLGGLTPSHLMAAVTAMKLGNSPEALLVWLASFMKRLSSRSAGQNPVPGDAGRYPERLGLRLKTLVDTLQGLLHGLNRQPAGGRGEVLDLLAGQLFAWTWEHSQEQHPFYYLPFFLLFDRKDQPRGELLIYPGYGGKQAGGTRCLLNLETRNLGWIQVELFLQHNSLKVGMLVESQATRWLLDRTWSKLAAALTRVGYGVSWAGCRVGLVRTPLRELTGDRAAEFRLKGLDLKV